MQSFLNRKALYLPEANRRKASAMSFQIIYGKDRIRKEIKEISGITCVEKESEVEEMAQKIAFDFFENHTHSDPVTVARASLFIALKNYKCTSEKTVQILINNNGKMNRWWLRLLPIIEKRMKEM